MFDSLNKYFSFAAGRNSDDKFSGFDADISTVTFRFYLVVERLDMQYAEQANDKFGKALKERFSQSYIKRALIGGLLQPAITCSLSLGNQLKLQKAWLSLPLGVS
jgi:hypothetical protein